MNSIPSPSTDWRLFLNLVRALIPRWNFFDQVGPRFELEYRQENSSDWKRVSFDQKRRWIGIFHNPETNLALLQVGLLEQIELPTTSVLLKDLIRTQLAANGVTQGSAQLKVVTSHSDSSEELYVSEWFPLADS